MLTRRADFEPGKKPAYRNFSEVLPDIRRVVPWNVVEPGPAGNAIKIQTERRGGHQPGFQILKRLFKIVARPLRIAPYGVRARTLACGKGLMVPETWIRVRSAGFHPFKTED